MNPAFAEPVDFATARTWMGDKDRKRQAIDRLTEQELVVMASECRRQAIADALASQETETRRLGIVAGQARFKGLDGDASVARNVIWWRDVARMAPRPCVKGFHPASGNAGKTLWQCFEYTADPYSQEHRERENLPKAEDEARFAEWVRLKGQGDGDFAHGMALNLAVCNVALIRHNEDGRGAFERLQTRFALPETIAWQAPDPVLWNEPPWTYSAYQAGGELPAGPMGDGLELCHRQGIALLPGTPETMWIRPPANVTLVGNSVSLPSLPAELAALLVDLVDVAPAMRRRLIEMELNK